MITKEVHEIMEHFSTMDNKDYGYSHVESEFSRVLNIGYQEIKPILIKLYKKNLYIDVIANYLKTNYNSFGNVSSEYSDVFNDLLEKGKISRDILER